MKCGDLRPCRPSRPPKLAVVFGEKQFTKMEKEMQSRRAVSPQQIAAFPFLRNIRCSVYLTRCSTELLRFASGGSPRSVDGHVEPRYGPNFPGKKAGFVTSTRITRRTTCNERPRGTMPRRFLVHAACNKPGVGDFTHTESSKASLNGRLYACVTPRRVSLSVPSSNKLYRCIFVGLDTSRNTWYSARCSCGLERGTRTS